MDIKLLKKFADNKCTPAEVEKVFSWVSQKPDKSSGQALFKNYWDNIEPMEEEPRNTLEQHRLDRIHHIINLNQSERLAKGTPRFFSVKKISLVQLLSRAAALLLIPVLTLFVYTRFFQSGSLIARGDIPMNEIVSPAGSRIFLELSDGTKVWLNHGSTMVYPQEFTGKSRVVELTGEGYFEVAHNKAKPFIVEAGGMEVKAVGTNFNVKAYPGNQDFETTLESGKVFILKKNSGKELAVCEMNPGQHFVFNNTTNKYSLKAEDLAKYVSWKEGTLIFIDDPLDKVAEQLSRWYNVEIKLEAPELNELTYTATFVDESLYQILEMLEIVTPISYTVSDREKMPDGTFTKRKISIYPKRGKDKK